MPEVRDKRVSRLWLERHLHPDGRHCPRCGSASRPLWTRRHPLTGCWAPPVRPTRGTSPRGKTSPPPRDSPPIPHAGAPLRATGTGPLPTIVPPSSASSRARRARRAWGSVTTQTGSPATTSVPNTSPRVAHGSLPTNGCVIAAAIRAMPRFPLGGRLGTGRSWCWPAHGLWPHGRGGRRGASDIRAHLQGRPPAIRASLCGDVCSPGACQAGHTGTDPTCVPRQPLNAHWLHMSRMLYITARCPHFHFAQHQ